MSFVQKRQFLESALHLLLTALEEGLEYPEAEWKALKKYGHAVTQEELANAYDEHDS